MIGIGALAGLPACALMEAPARPHGSCGMCEAARGKSTPHVALSNGARILIFNSKAPSPCEATQRHEHDRQLRPPPWPCAPGRRL